VLTHLLIRDVAIVAEVSLELTPGMTVLTGETGAGKSILVDALGLVLGDRAAPGVVRPGAERAEVVATFDTVGLPAVRARLEELDLAGDEGLCILRRTVAADGRSRAFLNGRPMPLQALREVGELLVDIHGQHAHQSLLRRDAQREALDHFGGHLRLIESCRALAQGWQDLRGAIAALGGGAAERGAEHELLRYQVQELRAAEVQPGEVESLDDEHRRLSHGQTLIEAARRAVFTLDEAEEGAIAGRLDTLVRELDEMARFDPRVLPVRELLEAAAIQAREAASGLRHYADGVDLDPERLRWLEQRIAALEALARKHRLPTRALPEHLAALEARLAELEHGEERLRAIEAELADCAERYRKVADRLHQARSEAAPRLAEAVTANARRLGMPGTRFEVRVDPAPGEAPSPHGHDRIEFLFSDNPGQPLAPLGQVASGGELSRLSLAIQLVGAHGRGVPTQVFDEVDSGVGGRVAESVGLALRQLADTCQVLCVTHLPQVAAQGHSHLQVSKATRDGATYAAVAALAHADRVQEVARMLAGVEVTTRALEHAREMLARASVPSPAP
jgi:DNA repair protein RecN (Recombination protein N)